MKLAEVLAELAEVRKQLASIEARLDRLEADAAPTMGAAEAMRRLGYKSGKRFWQAVHRLRIPYSRLSARHCLFQASDIDAALLRRQIGSRRSRLP